MIELCNNGAKGALHPCTGVPLLTLPEHAAVAAVAASCCFLNRHCHPRIPGDQRINRQAYNGNRLAAVQPHCLHFDGGSVYRGCGLDAALFDMQPMRGDVVLMVMRVVWH